MSLSVQPVLSLALRYKLSPNDCAAKLSKYFKHLGADMVIDMSIAEDFSLLEAQKEFINRFNATVNDGAKNALPMLASSCPGEESIIIQKLHLYWYLKPVTDLKNFTICLVRDGHLDTSYLNLGAQRFFCHVNPHEMELNSTTALPSLGVIN